MADEASYDDAFLDGLENERQEDLYANWNTEEWKPKVNEEIRFDMDGKGNLYNGSHTTPELTYSSQALLTMPPFAARESP